MMNLFLFLLSFKKLLKSLLIVCFSLSTYISH
nr:MAG TPA: Protein of unknown function (DUF2673) [Microviridae sp.]